MGEESEVEPFSRKELDIIQQRAETYNPPVEGLLEKYLVDVKTEKEEVFDYNYGDCETTGDLYVLSSDQIDYIDGLVQEYEVNMHHIEKFLGVGLPIKDLEGYLQFHQEYNHAKKELKNYLTYDTLAFVYSITRANHDSIDDVRSVISHISDDLESKKGVGEILYDMQHLGYVGSVSLSTLSTLNLLPHTDD